MMTLLFRLTYLMLILVLDGLASLNNYWIALEALNLLKDLDMSSYSRSRAGQIALAPGRALNRRPLQGSIF